jgi:hypothetical protein
LCFRFLADARRLLGDNMMALPPKAIVFMRFLLVVFMADGLPESLFNIYAGLGPALKGLMD